MADDDEDEDEGDDEDETGTVGAGDEDGNRFPACSVSQHTPLIASN